MATWIVHQLCTVMLVTIVFTFKIEHVFTFTIDLYQRDSFDSHFDNSNISSEIIRRAVTRSTNRSSNIITLNNPISKLIYYRAEYLMNIRLGNPPVDIFALMDTGSDLTWIQCQPCMRCVSQLTPFFNARDSTSYEKIPCNVARDKPCPSKSKSQCQEDEFCHYNVRYGDGSYSKGFLSKDTLRMGSSVSGEITEISDFIFGCGNDNFIKSETQVSAVIGLGMGLYSLVTQLGSHGMGKFAYCLIPLGSKERVSHIRFGPTENIHDLETITIPLVYKISSNLYFVTLEAFTIGQTKIKFKHSDLSQMEEGNIVIDSGTAMSTIPRQMYDEMKHVVMKQTNARPMHDPREQFDLCFGKDETLLLPDIVFNFRGGDVPLKRHNVFVSVDGMECLAFRVFDSDDVSICGSVAQQDFIVGYDRVGGTVSFKPFKCSEF